MKTKTIGSILISIGSRAGAMARRWRGGAIATRSGHWQTIWIFCVLCFTCVVCGPLRADSIGTTNETLTLRKPLNANSDPKKDLASWNFDDSQDAAYSCFSSFYQTSDGHLALNNIYLSFGRALEMVWRPEDAQSISVSSTGHWLLLTTTNDGVLYEATPTNNFTSFSPVQTNSFAVFFFNADEMETLHKVVGQLELLTGKSADNKDNSQDASRRMDSSAKAQMKKIAGQFAVKSSGKKNAAKSHPKSAGKARGRAKLMEDGNTLMDSWSLCWGDSTCEDDSIYQTDDGQFILKRQRDYGCVDYFSWDMETVKSITINESANLIDVETADQAVSKQSDCSSNPDDTSEQDSYVFLNFGDGDDTTMWQVAQQLSSLTGVAIGTRSDPSESVKQRVAAVRAKVQTRMKAIAAKNGAPRIAAGAKIARLSSTNAAIRLKALDAQSVILSSWDGTLADISGSAKFYQLNDGRLELGFKTDDGLVCLQMWRTNDVEQILFSDANNTIDVATTDNAVLVEVGYLDGSGVEPLLTNSLVRFGFNVGEKDAMNLVARQLELLTGKTVTMASVNPFAQKQKNGALKIALQNNSRIARLKAGGGAKTKIKPAAAGDILLAQWVYDLQDYNPDPNNWDYFIETNLYTDSYSLWQRADGSMLLSQNRSDDNGSGFNSLYAWPISQITEITTNYVDLDLYASNSILEQTTWADGDVDVETNGWLFMDFNRDDPTRAALALQLSSLTGVPVQLDDDLSWLGFLSKRGQSPVAAKSKFQIHANPKLARKASISKSITNQIGKPANTMAAKSKIKSLKSDNALLFSWKRGTGDYSDAYALYQSSDGQLTLSDQFLKDLYLSHWKGPAIESITLYELDNALWIDTADDAVAAEYSNDDGTNFGTTLPNNFLLLDFGPEGKDTMHRVAQQLELIAGKKSETADTISFTRKQKQSAFKAAVKKSSH